ncbi:MAG: DUF502 domain-containing protein [Deltaproteobacteria bacterium]|nr:MAG: DUF502 domain-containing protein [Deltaproteobacteria bacterium]
MKTFVRHMKTFIVRGFLAIIPLVLSILVIQILYNNIDRRVVGLLDRTIGFSFPGLGIILSLAALYLLGFVASNIVGKKVFGLIEEVTERLPLLKTTYQVGKQLADTLSLPEKQVSRELCWSITSNRGSGPLVLSQVRLSTGKTMTNCC